MSDVKPSLPPTYPFPVDPSEELAIDANKDNKNIWAVRIPRFLLERWERVDQAGVELGTLVVDNSTNPPKLSLRLPDTSSSSSSTSSPPEKLIDLSTAVKNESKARPNAGNSTNKRKHGASSYDTSNIPDEYEMHVPDERAKNTFVFTEKVRTFGGMDGGKGRREKAYPKLLAAVAHEVTVKPLQNEKYKKILAQRRLESEQTRRPIIKVENTEMTQADLHRMASGLSNSNARFGATYQPSALAKHVPDRLARMDIGPLRNRLFALFSEKPYWGIPALKATLQQPDTWLREVLKEIAEQVKEGKYVNMWTLKASLRSGAGPNDKAEAKTEDGDEDEVDGGEDGETGSALGDVQFDDADLGLDDDDEIIDEGGDEDDEEEFDEVEM